MFNKKRLFVAGAFIIALLFMTMYAGGSGEQETTAMRIVKFIDGFNNAEISSQNIEVGGDAEVPTDPKHENLLFIGWFEGDTRVTKFENIMEDLTVISRYVDDINNNGTADSDETPFIVTFYDTVSESNIGVVNVLEGLSATPPAAPEHSGHTFTGWSRSYTNVTSNITVDALYESNEDLADVTRHTVRFLADGEEISTQEIVNEATASEPSETVIPKKEKQVFIGWDKSFDNVTSDLTINAVYADDINENVKADSDEEKFTIRFETNGNGTFTGETSFTGLLEGLKVYDFIKVPAYEAKPGYTFRGWETELPEEDAVITDSFVYTAIFKDITKPEVIVSDIVDGQFNPEKFTFNAKDPNGIFSLSYTIRPKGEKDSVQSGYIKYQDILDDLTKTYSINELPDGEYELRISIRDVAENPNHGSVINFVIDTTSPEANITLKDIDGNSFNKNDLKFGEKVTIIGEVSNSEKHIRSHWFEITNPDGTLNYVHKTNAKELSYQFDLDTSKGSGKYRIRYVATDKAGNRNDDPGFTNSTIRTLFVDADAPVISSVEALDVNYKRNNGYDNYDNKPIKIQVNATDNYSTKLLYQYGSETKWVESNTYTRQWTAENFSVKVKDEFGNISTATIGIHIDSNPMAINYRTTGGTEYNGDYAKALKPIYIKPRGAWKLIESGYLWSDKESDVTKEELVNNFWHNDKISLPTEDGTYYLWSYATDYHGNTIIETSDAFIIDNVKPKDVSTHYSTTDPTNKAVIVTITFNEAVTIVNSGWEKRNDNDKTVWQKSFDSNNTEVIMFKDLAGNENETNISIANINKVPPKITFSGDNPLILGRIDFTFKPKDGASATDYEDEDITSQIIIIKNNLNIWEIGTYEIVYQVTDKFGNTTTRTRFVEVKRWKDL